MSDEGSYKLSDVDPVAGREIGRLRAQALWGWDKEARNLKWFGLRDGMSLLEIGSGPGFVTEQLLELVPNGRVTCLEIDPAMVARAKWYLRDKPAERLEILEGNVMALPFPDESFDFAHARLVFQHLPDPLGALREIRRVLVPGGKLAIVDVDSGLNGITDPASPEADTAMAKLAMLQAARGGNRKIGRRLWRLLAASGFSNLDLDAIVIHSDKLGVENMTPREFDPGFFGRFVTLGVITADELESLRKAHETFAASEDKYVLQLGLMAFGEKPATT